MFAVVVSFEIDPDQFDAFMPFMLENARISHEQEPGCLQFDVCSNPDNKSDVFLYEIYKSRADFDLHLNAPHFRTFDSKVTNMIRSKQVKTYETVTQ